MQQIDRSEGGGPWTHRNEEPLAPGDSFVKNYNRDNGGRLRPWAPMDSIEISNSDSANEIWVVINGKYEMPVEPNGVKAFGETGVVRWRITNQGGGTIDAEDVSVSAALDPYDADDAARSRHEKTPFERMVRGALNL